MAYSYIEYTATGSPQILAAPPYIDQSHIHVSVNGVEVFTWSWATISTINVTALAASTIRIYRKSSPEARVTDYMDGVPLDEASLDNDSKQAFYLSQEQLDATAEALGVYGSLTDVLAQINANLAASNRVSKAGDTMSGHLNVPAGAAGTQVPRVQEVVQKTGDSMSGGLTVAGALTAAGLLTASGGFVTTSQNGGQFAGLRNKIINGKMELGQRGISFPAPGSVYTLDRWINQQAGTSGVYTISQSTDVPSSGEFTNSLRATVTTADASVGVSKFALLQQRLLGLNVKDLIGKTFTLSFWVRSAKTGTHCVSFTNNLDRTWAATYTVNVADTWEYKQVTVTGGLITAGTWNYGNARGLDVNFVLMAGSNYHGAAGSWVVGGNLATAGIVNCLDTLSNIFAITGVQLEVGSVATPFEHRAHLELLLALAYFEKSYTMATAIPTITTIGALAQSRAAVAAADIFMGRFAVAKRAVPTITIYSTGTGASGNIRASAGVDRAASSLVAGEYAYTFSATPAVGESHTWHHVIDSEI